MLWNYLQEERVLQESSQEYDRDTSTIKRFPLKKLRNCWRNKRALEREALQEVQHQLKYLKQEKE
jgi:hypothetical protein